MRAPSVTTEQQESPSWAIVGGGMLGLTIAYRLAEQGQKVTLYEAGPAIGGLAGSWHLGEDKNRIHWDRHYHVTLLSDSRLRSLLTDLGLDEQMKWVETKTGFFTEGQLYSMSNSLEFLRFPPLRILDKLRLGGTIFFASKRKNWRSLEKVLVGDWLTKWSGRRTFEKMWRPLLEAKLGQCYKRTSATFIWATIARMYKARQSGLKKEMFGYLPGGYAHLLEQFGHRLKELGVTLVMDSTVESVVRQPDGRIHVTTNRETHAHERVVMTTPSPILTQLCPQLVGEERDQHEKIEYLGIVCASVVLRKPLATYYVTNITDSWAPFTAVIEMTTMVDPQQFDGKHLVYLPRYVSADDEAWQWTDAQLQKEFIGALERMYPEFSAEDVLAFRVSKARHVMALPTLNYSSNLPPQATAVPGLFAINSAHIVKGTLNVNEIIELAEQACEEVLLPSVSNAPSKPNSSQLACQSLSSTGPEPDETTSGEHIARS